MPASAERDLSSSTHSQSFKAFVSKHNRAYVEDTKEYHMRQALYTRRLLEVEQHNAKPGRLWNKGINHLSDWTASELTKLNGYTVMKSTKSTGVIGPHGVQTRGKFLAQIDEVVLPENKSWAHLKSLQKGSDQLSCGSCWAVSTVTALAANAEINGHARDFSEQELIDCVPNTHHCGGKGGCDGATGELAMSWVMEHGLDSRKGTPYLGAESVCKKQVPEQKDVYLSEFEGNNDGSTGTGLWDLDDMTAIGFHAPKSASSPGVQLGLKGWTRLPENEYEPILRALATTGPVIASAAATGWAAYMNGIFDDCSPGVVIDHAIVLAGYGSSDGVKYWTIKNSWGDLWGENGYLRLLRKEDDKYCGTDTDPSMGTGCVGGPSQVRVCGVCGIHYDAVVPHFHPKP
jgi:cathepsin L